jgi:hypothetical protein
VHAAAVAVHLELVPVAIRRPHRTPARDHRLGDELEDRWTLRDRDAGSVVEAPTGARDGAGAREGGTGDESAVGGVERQQPEVPRLLAARPVEVRAGIGQGVVDRLARRVRVGREAELAYMIGHGSIPSVR